MSNKALSVGVNRYKQVTPLRGCLNDVRDISNLVQERLDIKDSNLKKLEDDEVTKNNLLDNLNWLKDVDTGGTIFFHFSGHGSYEVDSSGDEEDKQDELLCLYDMQWGNPNTYLKDDELNVWLSSVPAGVRVIVLLDCCHSGTGTRTLSPPHWPEEWFTSPGVAKTERTTIGLPALIVPDPNNIWTKLDERSVGIEKLLTKNPDDIRLARFVEPPQEARSRAAVRGSRKKQQSFRNIARSATNTTLFAACKDDQTAADARIEGEFCGAFSFAFRKSANAFPAGTGDQIKGRINEILANRKFTQEPQFEGDLLKPLFPVSRVNPSSTDDNTGAPTMSDAFNILRVDWTIDLTDLTSQQKEDLKNLLIDKLARSFDSPEATPRGWFDGGCSHERHERTNCGGSGSTRAFKPGGNCS